MNNTDNLEAAVPNDQPTLSRISAISESRCLEDQGTEQSAMLPSATLGAGSFSKDESASLVPAKRAEMALFAHKGAKQPFTYDYQSGATVYLSQREKVLADTFLETFSYTVTAQAIRERFKSKTTDMSVRRWLKRTHVAKYLEARLAEKGYLNGMSKERWLREAIEYRDGKKIANPATAGLHRLIGQAMGYIGEGGSKSFNAENLQINFTEKRD